MDFSLLLGDHEKEGKEESLSDSTSNESDALLGRFIRRLTMVVVHHVPLFWGLALSIFTGKFGAVCISLSSDVCHPTYLRISGSLLYCSFNKNKISSDLKLKFLCFN